MQTAKFTMKTFFTQNLIRINTIPYIVAEITDNWVLVETLFRPH